MSIRLHQVTTRMAFMATMISVDKVLNKPTVYFLKRTCHGHAAAAVTAWSMQYWYICFHETPQLLLLGLYQHVRVTKSVVR